MAKFLPFMDDVKTKTEMISVFGGYNHSLKNREGEFDDMKNMASNRYPTLAPRNTRGIFTLLTTPRGLAAKSNLFWVDGTTLYYNGVAVSGLTLTATAKQFVSMGAYLLIWPDKVYFDTTDSSFGSLNASIAVTGAITASICMSDGTAYATPTVSETEPEDPSDGDLWIDTSQITHILRQYSELTGEWGSIATTYVKIGATNVGKDFNEWDGVTIAGMTDSNLNGDFVLYGVGDDYIIVQALIDSTVNQTGGLTVDRTAPDMDFLTECDNRVWGCSSTNHEVYASKLGDPFNWNCFMRLSTDSYAATIGSDGSFTGACTHLGQILFFKEDRLHKVSGTQPSNFSIYDIPCRGVEKNSEKSLAIVNERLYYKSRYAICMYDGSLPVEVSGPLGDARYTNAVAGALGNKYYVSMKDSSSAYHLFVYDESLGMWHKEDNTNASYFAAHQGELFYIDATTKKIMTVNGRLAVHEGGSTYDAINGKAESAFDWYAETGDIGMAYPGNKYVSKLMLRIEPASGATFTVSVKYDDDSAWTDYSMTPPTYKKNITLNIIPQRCDHMRIKVSGSGMVKIYSLTKTIEGGGD